LSRSTPERPERGDIWLANLDPTAAGEQGGTRPVLVVSTNAFNAWAVGLVVVVPITSRNRGFAHHVPIGRGGLDRASFAMPEYVRSISQRRLRQRLGETDAATASAVDDWLRRIIGRW
jgi:mRNA interferase MazF